MNLDQETKNLISSDFELEFREDEPFVDSLAYKIDYLLEHNPDLLFSYFYRLDISEKKIEEILLQQGPIAVNLQLANLIIERQIKRAETKRTYKIEKDIDWMDFP